MYGGRQLMEETEMDLIHHYELDMLRELERITKRHDIKYFLAYGSAIGAVRHKGFIPWDSDVDIVVGIDNYERLDNLLSKQLNKKYEVKNYKNDNTASLLFSRIVLRGESGIVVHIDIFPLVGLPNNKIKQHIFIRLARLVNGLYFFKKVNPEMHYKGRKMNIRISKLLKVFAFPIPSKLLISVKERLEKRYSIKDTKYLFNLCGAYGTKEIILKDWLADQVYMDFEDEKLPLPIEYDKYLTQIYGDYMTPKKSNYV